MTTFSKILVIGAIVAAITYAVKKIKDTQIPIEEKLEGKQFQRIRMLKLADIIQWVNDNITEDFTSGNIRVCPVSKEFSSKLSDSIKLSPSLLEKCIYFDVVDENEKIVISKFVLPENISDDLAPAKEGKVYLIPLEK